jgi:hypothetical protein
MSESSKAILLAAGAAGGALEELEAAPEESLLLESSSARDVVGDGSGADASVACVIFPLRWPYGLFSNQLDRFLTSMMYARVLRNCGFAQKRNKVPLRKEPPRKNTGKKSEREFSRREFPRQKLSRPHHSREKRRSTRKKQKGGANLVCSLFLFLLSLSLSLSLYRSTMAAATWRGALSRNMQELR